MTFIRRDYKMSLGMGLGMGLGTGLGMGLGIRSIYCDVRGRKYAASAVPSHGRPHRQNSSIRTCATQLRQHVRDFSVVRT